MMNDSTEKAQLHVSSYVFTMYAKKEKKNSKITRDSSALCFVLKAVMNEIILKECRLCVPNVLYFINITRKLFRSEW